MAISASQSASAALATPKQRMARTSAVYRLCAGNFPKIRAITNWLRRQKASLSEARRAVFEQ